MKVGSFLSSSFLLLVTAGGGGRFGGSMLVAATTATNKDADSTSIVGEDSATGGIGATLPAPTRPAKTHSPTGTPTLAPTVTPSVSPSASSTSMPSNPPSEYTRVWEEITYDGFEGNDLGNFEVDQKGKNVARSNTKDYIYKGSRALRLRKNAAVRLKQNYDVTDYEDLRLSFWIYLRGLESYGYNGGTRFDKFFVEYSDDGGSNWDEIKEFKYGDNQGSDNGNGRFHYYIVDFNENNIVFTDQARIRLRLDGNKDNDIVYIDEIRFEGYKAVDTETPWNEITDDDFEGSWGSFTTVSNSGEDAVRVSNPGQKHYVPEGNAALRIRDNSGRQSSVFHKDGHDLTAYSECQVSFSFGARGMEDNEAFLLEYSSGNGSGWTEVKKYIMGGDTDDDDEFYFWNVEKKDDKWNRRFYSDTVLFENSDTYNLNTTNAKIRFRCKGSRNDDRVYIDEVLFECRE